jgi:PTH1 family peptidyl-tRNA hydrolase
MRMKLIVFLGNPGLKYRKTRHNVGFMIGDAYAKEWGVKFKLEKKFSAEIVVIASNPSVIASVAKQSMDCHDDKSPRNDNTILLAKPQLFYNLTGDSVAKIMNFYKIAKSDLLVVCDDLNLSFGKIRHREKGSDGGNNGLKSIIQHFGQDFARIRVGTDNELRAQIGDTDFVLSKFSRAEQTEFAKISGDVIDLINEKITYRRN